MSRRRTGGERRRDAAHALLDRHRAEYLLRLRRRFLDLLLRDGETTIERARDGVPTPEGMDGRAAGAVAVPFAKAVPPIVAGVGYEPATGAVRHARPVMRWRLLDAAAAEQWLAAHPGAAPPPAGALFDAGEPNAYGRGA